MAGEPITRKCQRANTVSPHELNIKECLAPNHEEAGVPDNDNEDKEEVVEVEDGEEPKIQSDWKRVQDQVDDLNERVARRFEDANDDDKWNPPLVKSPPQFAREQRLQHQLIHTPYEPWCKHCIAARVVRANSSNRKTKGQMRR